MNAITLRSGKLLDEPKSTQVEECEGVVKEKGKSPMEEEVNLVGEEKEQGKHEEVIKHRMVEFYRPSVPLP